MNTFATLLVVAPILGAAWLRPPVPHQELGECEGCAVTGGDADSDMAGSSFVVISAETTAGFCVPVGLGDCVGAPCEADVNFAWSSPSAGSWCKKRTQPPGQLPVCAQLESGAGSDSSNESLACGETYEYTIQFGSLEATTTVACSKRE